MRQSKRLLFEGQLPQCLNMNLRRPLLFYWLISVALAGAMAGFRADLESTSDQPSQGDEPSTALQSVYVVPIQGQINDPQLFILRRALKQAVEEGVNTIVLDMDTPGGSAAAMMEMMDALDRFPGDSITYVNDEAISAGAFIASATRYIYMQPKGLIGAAELVLGTGEDVPEGMKRKVNSYLQAKVRSLSAQYRYRGDVLRAMSDPDFVLEIDGEIITTENELLTLTGEEAVRQFGEPPENLLADGLAESLEEMLDHKLGAGQWEIIPFEVTWSEEAAKYLAKIAPALLGIGMLMLFIEFKTPGFGFFGITGIALVATVFATNYVAGLSGHEALLVFVLGVALVVLEIFLFPGVFFLAGIGLILMVGSLVWAMADIWPEGSDFTLTAEVFVAPLWDTLLAFGIGIFGVLLLSRVIPKRWYWSHLVLQSEVGRAGSSVGVGREGMRASSAAPVPEKAGLPPLGSTGIAVTDLFPSGEIEIDDRRFQARTHYGQLRRGTTVEVVDHKDFALIVKPRDRS